MRKKYITWGIILLFIITFYWVEFSPWSSTALQSYNNGYGTFDMKSYDVKSVYTVLGQMEPKGFIIYKKYFIGDFLFVIGFGGVQILLSLYAYKWTRAKWLRIIVIGVPTARGLFDIIENILLLSILLLYPVQHPMAVTIAGMATTMKLCMIGIWGGLFILGIVIKLGQFIMRKRVLRK
ncbi:hypothetical protein CS063_14070 [Sporanaerobium hydrogeniformans]|uniref:Uncharacterized protein n=1 Tax=Sporanaerobium hydrogeniformans TaxID=3072179 RepID=A0AC61D8X7_9FIRM|nr:hypothetical protein [Sporanaerobium hydrogeniformans]PHV69720.1 hypothetical protein CS063_14070 [Sporanaerobium hydrogeniformans]